MGDSNIIENILNGYTDNYELLVIKYQKRLYLTVISIVRNNETAEDIVQESFIIAYEKLHSLRNKDLFYPWIKKIAINRALLIFGQNKQLTTYSDTYTEENINTNRANDNIPENHVLKKEVDKYIIKFIDSLPDRLRIVLILREFDNLSYEDISDLMDIPVGTVRSRLHNARQHLKKRLINQGLADGLHKIS